MQDRIKELDRDIRLARTETSAISEHVHNIGYKPLWNEVKFIDREAIHIRPHPNNINRDSGCPRSKNTTTGEPCDSGPLREQITECTARIECTNQSC